MKRRKRYLLSLGGSLIVPNGGVDTEFLTKFNYFIRSWVKRGAGFVIVTGGGEIARHYRDAARKVLGRELTNDDLDWLGIHATRLNSHLIRTIFRDIAHPRIIKHYEIILKSRKPLLIAAGWKPGWSTDYCATILAEDYDFEELINLSNIDFVYNKDPRKNHQVEALREISWKEYRQIVGDKWIPGMNVPFDPIAAKKAEKLRLTVKVVNGKDFDNLEKCFLGEKFRGTTIKYL